jgi:hypothetical protein
MLLEAEMKKSIWSILVIFAALMISSCGKDSNETANAQFGIYSAFVTDANNPIPLTSTDGQMQLYLTSDGTYKVTGTAAQTGRYGVSGSVLSLEGFGQAIPVDGQAAGINTTSPFTGTQGTGTQNYSACIQVNITSAAYFGSNNYSGNNGQFNNNNNGQFNNNNNGTFNNNNQNFGSQNLKFFCR